MFEINSDAAQAWSESETLRSMFGKIMTQLAKEDPEITLVVADSGRMCKAETGFSLTCPDQYIDCGISEQNAIGVAAGLAHMEKKPVVFAFSPFATERCFEQVRIDIAYADLGVVIVGADAGIAQATLGVTHYGWEDEAAMRALPGMTVLCPADHVELYYSLRAAIDSGRPTYLRLTGGGGKPHAVYRRAFDYRIGRANVLFEGADVQIFACGTILHEAQEAVKRLSEAGVSAGLTDMHTIKPLDRGAVERDAGRARLVVTVEEHSVIGGLGSAVAEVLAEAPTRSRLLRIGLPDAYPKGVSTYPVMAQAYGLTAEGIAEKVNAHLAQMK